MDCKCEAEADGAGAGWMGSSSNLQMGGYAVVGYLLYRFSQTLPALIRWPIRIFCSITGLSALWGWVGRLVRTITGIGRVIKWLTGMWRWIQGSSRHRDKVLHSSLLSVLSGRSVSTDLRLIVLGSADGGQTSVLDTNGTSTRPPTGSLKESTKRRIIVDDNGHVTVIDTPDLLGLWTSNEERAREALRSLQLASPGPHAFLLVIQVPGVNRTVHLEARRALQTTLDLFGEAASEYIIPVLTHTDHVDQTVEQLLDQNNGALRTVLSVCSQRAELVDVQPHCPPLEEQRAMGRKLMEHVMELKEQKGHFIHELQRRENQVREELLEDMSCALAKKLGPN
uniref:GTPase IMAP family member 4-like n=1 Tax=Sphaeramia orbicularis TaxID=375764 RepID=A0A673C438_9TELE